MLISTLPGMHCSGIVIYRPPCIPFVPGRARLPGQGADRVRFPCPRCEPGVSRFALPHCWRAPQDAPLQNLDYSSSLQAYGIAQGQLAYYHALEKAREVRLIKNSLALDGHMASWEGWETVPTLPQPVPGLVISMESADPIQSPRELAAWRDAGVRIIGPAHYGPGRYAGGTSTELGLTALGKDLLREMGAAWHPPGSDPFFRRGILGGAGSF